MSQFEYLESTAYPIKAPLNNVWNSNMDSVVKSKDKVGNKITRQNWIDTRGGATQAWIPYDYCKKFVYL